MIILTSNFIDAEVDNKLSFKGEYRLVKTSAAGVITEDTGWFDNLILTSGLNRWGTGAVIAGAAIGTGTTPAANTQTSLIAQSAWTTAQPIATTNAYSGGAPYFITTTINYRFAAGTLNGNYSEIGVGWQSGSMFSRALIVDGLGAPTTITVGSAEALDVYYRLRVYPPANDVTTNIVISGVTYAMTARPHSVTTSIWAAPFNRAMGVTDYYAPQAFASNALSPVTSQIALTGPYTSTESPVAYVNNSMVKSKIVTFTLTQGNAPGGIGLVAMIDSGSAMQYSFTPSIPKDSTKTLALTLTTAWTAR